MLTRDYNQNKLKKGKVNLLYGPRRVGKTTALKKIASDFDGKVYFGRGEDRVLRSILDSMSTSTYMSYFDEYDLVIIDEAQLIPEIGTKLKLLIDILEEITVIASGSSSFELANQVGEPLVGRYVKYTMYPVSALEYVDNYTKISLEQNLEDILIYGSYPEVLEINSEKEKQEYLDTLVEGYLYRDILIFESIRNADKIQDLLRLIAFQIGNEVSTSELADKLDISKHTVVKYLDLLEKTFVIRKVRGFSRNLRKEITKSNRYYFYDNGILNSIIRNFNRLEFREDVGRLWENYLFIERIKNHSYKKESTNYYFWRTYDQSEIDLVEERGGKLYGYEFKWGNKNAKAPLDWIKSYPDSSFEIINRENYLSFVL